MLFIYRLQAMPDASRTLERWRQLWRAGGIGEVEVIKFDTHGDFNDPARYGADAAAQFLPHGLAEQEPLLADVDAAEGNLIYDYEDAMRLYLAASQPAWRRYECVVPMWDNTSRRGDGRSLVLHDSTPALYEEWLRAVAARAGRDGLVLINAWNEWAEGAHLEPDLEHGDEYLKATARALTGSNPAQPSGPPPLSVVPFELRDRFAELYLDGLETQTVLQRRLSRLEATLDRQITSASEQAEAELTAVRAHAESLSRENQRLRRELQLAGGASPDRAGVG